MNYKIGYTKYQLETPEYWYSESEEKELFFEKYEDEGFSKREVLRLWKDYKAGAGMFEPDFSDYDLAWN
jgi:hypothetical protein